MVEPLTCRRRQADPFCLRQQHANESITTTNAPFTSPLHFIPPTLFSPSSPFFSLLPSSLVCTEMTTYSNFKVTELKDILKQRGIPSTGLSRKQLIVDALEKDDAQNATASSNGVVEEQKGRDDTSGAAPASVPTAEEPTEQPANPDDASEKVERDPDDGNAEREKTAANEQPQKTMTGANQSMATDDGDAIMTDAAEPAAAPAVVENHQHVTKDVSAVETPKATSPAVESSSSDRKRKRRSPTPPVDEEAVHKKLRAAKGGPVKLPEDGETQKGTLPTSDQTPSDPPLPLDTSMTETPAEPTPRGTRYIPNDDASESTSPAVHPATRAIYISNLIRPIQVNTLRHHLIAVAQAPRADRDPNGIETLHLGSIRTHAFAIFTTVVAASRARSSLHGRIWPDEPARKPLHVDFVPEELVPEWIARENDVGSKRDVRKWEVTYTRSPADGSIVATHREGFSTAAAAPVAQSSLTINTSHAPDAPSSPILTPGMGMPNAPLGPRSTRPAAPPPRHPSTTPPRDAAPAAPPRAKPTTTFTVLDTTFLHTTTKPKLYFQPVHPDIVDARRAALAHATSRYWTADGAGPAYDDPAALRKRYTFEDGARVVDGGVDIPSFPHEMGARRRGRGGPWRGDARPAWSGRGRW